MVARRKIQTGSWFGLWVGFILFLIWGMSGSVSAYATALFPDNDIAPTSGPYANADPWQNVSASVAIVTPPGAPISNGRDSPISEFKIFYQLSGPGATGQATFNIVLDRACEGVIDPNAINTDMIMQLYTINPATGEFAAPLGGQYRDNRNPADCIGNAVVFQINRTDLVSVPGRYDPMFSIIGLRVEKINPGVSSFVVNALDGNGRASFNELSPALASAPGQPSTNAFAIYDGINRESNRNYVFEFRPDCNYFATYPTAYIKWFDADAFMLEGGDIAFDFQLLDFDGSVKSSFTIDATSAPISIGDNNVYAEALIPAADQDDYYRWVWRNVRGQNGVQFWMPFSEFNIDPGISCGAGPGGSLTCSVVLPASVSPGSIFTARFRITNNTSSQVDIGDGYLDIGADHASRGTGAGTENYMAPNAANWVRTAIDWSPGQIAPGGFREWNRDFQASQVSLFGGEHRVPGAGLYSGTNLSPGSYDFDWRIMQGAAWYGAPCQGTLNVALPAVSVTCAVTVTPSTPSINQNVILNVSVQNTSGVTINNPNADIQTRVSIPGLLAPTLVTFPAAALPPGGSTVGTVTLNAGAMGSWTATAVVTGLATTTCPSSLVTVAAKPYVKFFGGDVYAGGWFNDGVNACAVQGGDATATIKTFARNDRTPNTYHGSSVEFASFTMAGITGDSNASASDQERGFYSAAIRGSGTEGMYLTFANTNSGYVPLDARWHGNFWGGSFANTPKCIDDYYTATRLPTISAVPQNLNLNSIGVDGQYEFPSGVGVNTFVVQMPAPQLFTRRATIYAAGDVYIDDDIRYDTNFAAGIPYLTIIAKGNIYIDAGVTNIDALLIAQPVDTTGVRGGRIYTCASRTGFSFSLFDQASLYGACRTKLTIHGALIAQQVRFLRTNGSLHQAGAPEFANSATIAEVIDTTPEFYMGTPMFRPRTGTTTGAQMYHAIQGLPPVF